MDNPIYFIIDCMSNAAQVLSRYTILGVDILTWFFGFIFIGMVVSCFWRGARG